MTRNRAAIEAQNFLKWCVVCVWWVCGGCVVGVWWCVVGVWWVGGGGVVVVVWWCVVVVVCVVVVW